MKKNIKCELDQTSLDKAMKELTDYKNSINDKLRQLVTLLLQDGIEVAKASLASTVGDSDVAGTVADGFIVDSSGDIVKAIVFLSGKDVLFIEFGAGIYYNNGNAHPKASALGYGVGTYPSEHPPNRAINPGYWWYKGDDDAKHLSLGTMASMPMYHAAENMRNKAIMRAMEVFRS